MGNETELMKQIEQLTQSQGKTAGQISACDSYLDIVWIEKLRPIQRRVQLLVNAFRTEQLKNERLTILAKASKDDND